MTDRKYDVFSGTEWIAGGNNLKMLKQGFQGKTHLTIAATEAYGGVIIEQRNHDNNIPTLSRCSCGIVLY